ncbi:coproporphyrinogen III oxidase, partial [Bariatricus massiliensis]|nr:coproporphyrinogen III oxidase [Bariatricus massiliensis]
DGAQMTRIMGKIRKNYRIARDAEITVEMNPGTVTEDKLELNRQTGVNSLSIAQQSVHDDEIKMLGRIHT